jgi:diguanylate cyclase (GGDEF)-like protein/PAS domain S-box-containing protein
MNTSPKKPYKTDEELLKEAKDRLEQHDLLSQKQTEQGVSNARLLHELQVHQVELELQHRELRETRNLAEVAAARYTDLYDFAPVAYVTLNRAGEITRANLASATLLGTTRDKLEGARLAGFVAHESLSEFNCFLSQSFTDCAQTPCEIIFGSDAEAFSDLHSGASLKPSYVQLGACLNETGVECRVVLTDISESKQADVKLKLAASVFNHAREGIMITDSNGVILEVNDRFTEVTGYSREEAVGKNPRILRSGRQSSDFYDNMWQQLMTNGFWCGEIWNKRKNGEAFPEMQSISQVRDASGKTLHYVSMFSDITDLKAHQEQLEHTANYDILTNLPNRASLGTQLPLALLQTQRKGKMLAVAYLDLDGFKKVNDMHGHSAGDEFLVAVSRRLAGALRAGDILARIGGDEFVAVLVDIDKASDCEPVLERLLTASSEEIILNGKIMQVSTSIGVTLYPQNGTDPDMLLRQADQAMYLAKSSGRNCYQFFDLDSEVADQAHRETLKHIREAFQRREFALYYQPKINMKTNAVVGVEALIRWLHPEQGVLFPDMFLPVIEGHSLGIEIGQWVIDTALSQMSDWQEQGLDINVSVNVSASQLQCHDFLAGLQVSLRAHPDVKPEHLELEILETSALEEMDDVSKLMEQCLKLGVFFALDDFGTGYSSLTYLKQLPAAELKIDRSFVRDMLTDPSDLAIVKAVISLAEVFDRRVIAEGVETYAHAEKLLSLNCEMGQGYGIALPMPAEDLYAWVKRWEANPVWLE